MFATDLSKPWSWSVMFDSTTTKQIHETKDARFAKDFEGITYTYRLRTTSAANQLLVTVQSSPLIPDGELVLYFRWFDVVKKVVGQSHSFNHQIDNDLRCIILLLNEDVVARDIPGFMKKSVGIRRKLFFRGMVFYCSRCHSKHTFHKGCPSEQGDEEQQRPTEQNENREQQDLPEATPELHQDSESPFKKNEVEKNEAATEQPTNQEGGAEEALGDRSKLENKHPFATDATQQQPNPVVKRKR